jgi:hypothetical protein
VQKIATVGFATSSADVNAPLTGVFITAVLPAGVTVATIPGSSEISSTALKGAATGSGQLVLGTYSAPIRKVKITVASAGTDMAIGPFASLICDVIPGNTLNESQFTSIVPLEFQATGPGGIDLTTATPPVVPKISVTFGF